MISAFLTIIVCSFVWIFSIWIVHEIFGEGFAVAMGALSIPAIVLLGINWLVEN